MNYFDFYIEDQSLLKFYDFKNHDDVLFDLFFPKAYKNFLISQNNLVFQIN